ncbi:MAG: winged helix-turn-helix domain-containing protein [Spirochaetota bacterium]
MRIRSKIWIEQGGKTFLGVGRLNLLKEIQKQGSILKASEKLNISFRRAWSHIDRAERSLGKPLLEKHRGGKGGGSSVLTEDAELLLQRFEQLVDEAHDYTKQRFEELFGKDFPVDRE